MGCEIMPSRCEGSFPRNEAECEGSFAVSPVPAAFGRDCALSGIMPENLKGREVNGMGVALTGNVPGAGA